MKKSRKVLSYLLAGSIALTAIPTIGLQVSYASNQSIETIAENEILKIPDVNFRKFLIEKVIGADRAPIPSVTVPEEYTDYPLFGTDIPKLKLAENVEIKTWSLPSNKDIKSIEGIEYLSNLKKTDIQGITLQSIDFSKNKSLESIRVDKCRVSEGVNVNGLEKLESLVLSDNIFNKLDVTTNISLEKLQSTAPYSEKEKGLTAIDLSKNTGLEELNLTLNPLKTIDLTNNKSLKEVLMVWTNVESIAMEGYPELNSLSVRSEFLKTAIVKNNAKLEKLYLSNNPLENLDLENNPMLKILDLGYNPNLKALNLDNSEKLEQLTISSSGIESLSLRNNKMLKTISGYNAKLIELDLSDLQELNEVDLRKNSLNEIILKNNVKLDKLKVTENNLKAIDLTQAPALRYLECEDNKIVSLDTGSLKLNNIKCKNNKLRKLDLTESNISSVGNAAISPQNITILGTEEEEVLTVNINNLVGEENASKIVSVDAPAVYDATTGLVKVNKENPSFVYKYKAAVKQNYKGDNFDIIMEVTVNLFNSEKIVSMEKISEPVKTSYRRGEKFSPEGIILRLRDDKQNEIEIGPEEFEKYGIKVYNKPLMISDKEVTITREGLEDITIPITITKGSGGGAENPTIKDSYIDGYEDSTFKPDNEISRAESAKIIAYALKNFDESKKYETSFSDVADGSWYKNIIGFLEKEKGISGYEDGRFKPDGKITRAEFCSIVARLNGFKKSDMKTKFTDLGDHWALEHIIFAENKGWITGYGDGTFRPDQQITRAEAVRIINNILGLTIDKNKIDSEIDKYKVFSDVTKDHWAYYEIIKAANLDK